MRESRAQVRALCQLPLCAMSLLAAVVLAEVADTDQLLTTVPFQEPAFALPDVGAWFNQLQLLLDLGLVVREPAPHAFVYSPTDSGMRLIYAWQRKGAAA